MNLIGADANFCAQAKFESVIKASTRIDHHRRRIDFGNKPLCGGLIAGHNGIRMVRAIPVNPLNRLIQTVHNTYRKLQIKILSPIVIFGCDQCPGNPTSRSFTAANFDPLLFQHPLSLRQERVRDRGMYEQRFGGVANPRPLTFAVLKNPQRHVLISRLIDIDMADPVKMFNDGHASFASDSFDQGLSAARNCHINLSVKLQQLANDLAFRRFHQLNRVFRQTSLHQRISQHAMQRQIAV